MTTTTNIFERLGFSANESKVYHALLKSGPASIRTVAGATGINRGTVYEALRRLSDRGLVTRSQKKRSPQFVAEDPEVLQMLFRDERRRLVGIRNELTKSLPQLKTLFNAQHRQPVARIYEGNAGTALILEDVLKTVGAEKRKEYYVYSAANIREYLYYNFGSFSDRRIKAGITTKVIALGAGGELRGLDERRWLTEKRGAPAYTIIYANKVALISLGAGSKPVGVVIEDSGVAETQRLIFESLWKTLEHRAA
jgi:sugar-specific transcriptional regulator TrmB